MKRIDYNEIVNVLEVLTRGMERSEAITEMEKAVEEFIAGNVLPLSKTVTLSGFYKNPRGGPSIQAFEEEIRRFLRTENEFVTCSNGTSALHLALMAAGIGPGDRVAVPAITFSATATAVLQAGATPVFVDVDRDTYGMDASELFNVCRDEPIKAAIPVHLLGVPCRMNAIMGVAQKFDVTIIEDNAQALGADYRKVSTGTWGDFGTNSFQETKVLSTAGEGGGVISQNPEAAEKMRQLRNHGQQYGEARYNCWNYRMTEVQAAMGIAQLAKLRIYNEWQRKNRDTLRGALERHGFRFQMEYDDSYSTFYILGSTVNDTEYRDRVAAAFKEKGWSEPIPGQTIGKGYTRTIMDLPLLLPYKRHLPISEWLVQHYIWFDCHRWIDPETFAEAIAPDIENIVENA